MSKNKFAFIALVLVELISFSLCFDLAILPLALAQTPTTMPEPTPAPTPIPEPTPFPTTSSSTTSIDITTTTSVDSSTTSSISAPTPTPAPSTTTTTDEGDPCTFYLEATSLAFPYTVSTGRIQVTASRPFCIWSCSTASPWITITTEPNNSGDGAVEFTVAENTLPSARTATLYIAAQEVVVTQNGAPAPLSTTTTTASVSTSSVQPTSSIPASTTTTAPFCPIRNILGEKPDNIRLIQEFRNNVLLNSSRGRYYVLRYYQHAREIMQIVQQNPLIRNRAAAFMQTIMPDISLLLQRKTLEISPEPIDEAIRVCDLVSAEASPALQQVIKNLKHDLTEGAFLSKLGIYINEIER